MSLKSKENNMCQKIYSYHLKDVYTNDIICNVQIEYTKINIYAKF